MVKSCFFSLFWNSGGCTGICKAEEEMVMERNEVYGVSTTNEVQGNIEMKKNVVYGITSKSSEQEYENPL